MRHEPVSGFVHTDDERELRDRAWRFLTPAHERAVFDRALAELTRTRILPAILHPGDRDAYFDALMRGPLASPVSRYRRLGEDVVADAKLVGPFAITAARVNAADDVRLRALPHIRDLSEGEIREAAARVAENRCLIAWVRIETARRTAAYAYALEHLLIEAPQKEAVTAERALAALNVQRHAVDAVVRPAQACPGLADVPRPDTTVVVRRVEPGPLVTK